MSEGIPTTFLDVAGQTVTVQRPPHGYLVVADTDAVNFVISEELLRNSGVALGGIILEHLARGKTLTHGNEER